MEKYKETRHALIRNVVLSYPIQNNIIMHPRYVSYPETDIIQEMPWTKWYPISLVTLIITRITEGAYSTIVL